jgi:hypothetical protein
MHEIVMHRLCVVLRAMNKWSSAILLLVLGCPLHAMAAGAEPRAPANPTSYEQCQALSDSYLNYTAELEAESGDCYATNVTAASQEVVISCTSNLAAAECRGPSQAFYCALQRSKNAVQNCRDKVAIYQSLHQDDPATSVAGSYASTAAGKILDFGSSKAIASFMGTDESTIQSVQRNVNSAINLYKSATSLGNDTSPRNTLDFFADVGKASIGLTPGGSLSSTLFGSAAHSTVNLGMNAIDSANAALSQFDHDGDDAASDLPGISTDASTGNFDTGQMPQASRASPVNGCRNPYGGIVPPRWAVCLPSDGDFHECVCSGGSCRLRGQGVGESCWGYGKLAPM